VLDRLAHRLAAGVEGDLPDSGGAAVQDLVEQANVLTAKRRGINVAEQAARAGAGQLDLAAIRGGDAYRIDPSKARRAAQQYLAQAGYAGQVRLGRDRIGDRVDVSVTWSQRGLFTSLVGVGQYGGTVQASAYSCHGVAQEEGC
jgi:hypothetical protein